MPGDFTKRYFNIANNQLLRKILKILIFIIWYGRTIQLAQLARFVCSLR